MNPFDLDASGLLVWGIVAHLVADWPLQNDWMATRKGWPWTWSIAGLAPAVTHATIHAVALGLVFGYWPGIALGIVHLLIDTRLPVAWWSRLVRQTQPIGARVPIDPMDLTRLRPRQVVAAYDVGTEVRFWTDQVFHIACIAVAALVVS